MIHLIPIAITVHDGLVVPVKANTSLKLGCLIWTAPQFHVRDWSNWILLLPGLKTRILRTQAPRQDLYIIERYTVYILHICLMFLEKHLFNVGQNSKRIISSFLNFESQCFFVAHSSLGDFEVPRQPDVFFCASSSASLGRVRYWQLALAQLDLLGSNSPDMILEKDLQGFAELWFWDVLMF